MLALLLLSVELPFLVPMETQGKSAKQRIYWESKKIEINQKRRKRYHENAEVREQTYLRRIRWQLENPEKYREQLAKSNTKRLRFRFEILKRDNFKCVYCGTGVKEATLHIDHVYPQSKGGLSIASNLVTACSNCNMGKSDVLLT